jgi:hypothetical protein
MGPLEAADAPLPAVRVGLLAAGNALVGSSYDPTGPEWALRSALSDQFQALAGFEKDLPSAPKQVVAYGISMGGLITALEDEHSNGRLDGVLTACGVVAGGVVLKNYELDGEYAIARLLAPSEPVQLVGFAGAADAVQTAKVLDAAARQAQATGSGRARLALAMAFSNVPTWAPGAVMPGPKAYAAQEAQQFAFEFSGTSTTLEEVELFRASMEQAAGGNPSWTAGVNFTQLLQSSPYAPEVKALYKQAGLKLDADLAALTSEADIKADSNAVEWMEDSSVPTGRLQVPELDMHTIADQLAPVQQENYYADTVQEAGASGLLRQVFVRRQVHCNFTFAELLTGVLAVQHRIKDLSLIS